MKHKIMLKGAIIHFLTYVLIGLVLFLLGVQPYIIFVIMGFLLWGFFMLSYIHYKKK